MTLDAAPPPLSRLVSLSEVPPEGLELTFKATPHQRDALAAANGLAEVLDFCATIKLVRSGRDGLSASGEVRATVRQVCVVTLEEFDAEIVEPLKLRFAPPKPEAPERSRRGREETPEPMDWDATSDDDPPDPLIGGVVDIGAAAAEFLTLGLDPYPRKPGAVFAERAGEAAPGPVSPFARLMDAAPETPDGNGGKKRD